MQTDPKNPYVPPESRLDLKSAKVSLLQSAYALFLVAFGALAILGSVGAAHDFYLLSQQPRTSDALNNQVAILSMALFGSGLLLVSAAVNWCLGRYRIGRIYAVCGSAIFILALASCPLAIH